MNIIVNMFFFTEMNLMANKEKPVKISQSDYYVQSYVKF